MTAGHCLSDALGRDPLDLQAAHAQALRAAVAAIRFNKRNHTARSPQQPVGE